MDIGARVVFSCSNIVQDEYFIEPILDCMCMYCVLVFKYEEDCLMCQHSSQYIYKLTVCTSCATF